MGSETPALLARAARATRGARVRVGASGALLVLAGAALAEGLAHAQPRVAVGGALALAAALALALPALRRLRVAPIATDAADAAPPRTPTAEAARERRLALLETQLEQAPVALWWLHADRVEPLSLPARRLLAPGGATDRDALFAHLRAAHPAARPELVVVDTERGPERHLLAAREALVAGAPARLVALAPVESELEAQTLAAWRQLVHVLTHEIMNSLTPIASLSRTAHEMLTAPVDASTDAAPDEDLAIALDTIARRAESLAAFVDRYREVTRWPEPVLAPVALEALFRRVERLVGDAWRQRGGSARFTVEPATLTLMADAGQLEQVLLNLLRNAAQATEGVASPRLDVGARLVRGGRLAIEVRDNGPGAPPGRERDIFLPFFTTRADGSGIGLAVVRHLVQGMGGSVRYVRPPDGGACFVLAF